ncbi:MAG TPA: PAS domain S-box protein, partial [Nannocystaceae bacterium]|nr:PAS domain S-box protein [Nannocystaceae bacterium]
MVESSPEAVVVVDTSGRLRFINPAAARLLGATASELLGQPWRHLAPLVAGDGDRRVPPGRPLRRRAREVEIGGERLRIETFTPDDPPPLVEHLGDGVNVVRAHDSAIVYVNPAFERLFGYDPGEILGRHVSVVNAPTERDPLAVADEITGHLRAHGSWRGEVLNVRKDGRAFPCWAVVTSFEHPTHGLAWLALHSDISARKEAEAALRRAAEAALAATRAKS